MCFPRVPSLASLDLRHSPQFGFKGFLNQRIGFVTMKQSCRQPNLNNPRWDDVRAMLPVVSAWVATVSDLLIEAADEKVASDALDSGRVASHPELFATGSANHPAGAMPSKSAIKNPHTIPVRAMSAELDERQRLTCLFEEYLACQEEFSRAQWAAICLRFRDGHTQIDIADRLGKSRSAVHGLLQRAKTRKDAFQRNLRKERGIFARKLLNSRE